MEESQVLAEKQTPQKSVYMTVTPFSKTLALALFILLPFIGFWLGYTNAPVDVVEVERAVAHKQH